MINALVVVLTSKHWESDDIRKDEEYTSWLYDQAEHDFTLMTSCCQSAAKNDLVDTSTFNGKFETEI